MTKTIDKTKPGEDLKERVRAIKDQLPTNWKEILADQFPEYDSLKGANMFRNVISGRQAPDITLCQRMEQLVINSKLP